jgi:hypothetical protein
MENEPTFTAFAGQRRIASGPIRNVLAALKREPESGAQVLIFSDQSGAQHEFDLRGSEAEVLARLDADPAFAPSHTPTRTGPGRPRLGVVSREISLLPRHWEWLERQPGGASASLRRLVENAKKSGLHSERARDARYAAGKFMWGIAGDLPGFEEASRALYAKDQERLEGLIVTWPEDIRSHVLQLTRAAARLEQQPASEQGES